jgi:hypothetical protein
MKDFLLMIVLPSCVLTALWAVWREWAQCRFLGCESPQGKYCGRCGKPHPADAKVESA